MLIEETRKIIDKFLNTDIYPRVLDKDNLLGVVVYGSATTGYFDKNSDIDILILLNEAENSVRGVKYVDGTKIEYFIKPIEKFLSESVSFTNTNCPSHIALNQNCEILYGKKDFVKNILNADNEFYNKNHKKPEINYLQKIVQIDNRISSLKNIYERCGNEFEMVYYNVLEMIRTLHSANMGEADIPFVKAYRIYNDEDYYNKYVGKNAKNIIPNKEFVKKYNKCVEEKDNREIMMKNLINLYKFEKQNYKIDPKDYELIF